MAKAKEYELVNLYGMDNSENSKKKKNKNKKAKRVKVKEKTKKEKNIKKQNKKENKNIEKREKKREKKKVKHIEKTRKNKIKENKNNIESNLELDNSIDEVINMTNNKKENKKQYRELEKNPKKNKKNKSKQKIKIILKLLLLIFLIGGILAFAFTSPIFEIKNIVVKNNNVVPINTVVSLSGITMEENIFGFRKKDAIKTIEENPYIEDVEIDRELPDTVNISITERVATYCIQVLDKYAYINNQGYILEITDVSNGYIILEGYKTEESNVLPGNRLVIEDLENLENIIKITNSARENNILDKIISINITDEDDYILNVIDNKMIYLGDIINLTDKIPMAQVILTNTEGKSGKIFVNGDFNNGFKPYFREEINI